MSFRSAEKKAQAIRLLTRQVFAYRERERNPVPPRSATPRHTPGEVHRRQRRRAAERMLDLCEVETLRLRAAGVGWLSDDLAAIEPWPNPLTVDLNLAFLSFLNGLQRAERERDLQAELAGIETALTRDSVRRTANTINIQTDSTTTMSDKAGV
jgi:hypothetical protein